LPALAERDCAGVYRFVGAVVLRARVLDALRERADDFVPVAMSRP
jgi:hypothetical protein